MTQAADDLVADPARTYVRVGVFVHSWQAFGRSILRGIARQTMGREGWEYHIPWPLNRPWHEHDVSRLDALIVRIDGEDDTALTVGAHLPRVLIGSAPLTGVPLDLVWDNASAGRLAATHLLELGHTQFAFVGRLVYRYQQDRLAGFREALEPLGIKPHVLDVGDRQEGHQPCADMVAQWLPTLPQPVGVLAGTDPMGQDVLAAAHAHHRQVPEDLAVITIGDDELFCEMSGPPLSSVRLPGEELGRLAAALIEERVRTGSTETGPTHAVPSHVVHARRSSDLLRVPDSYVAQALSLIRQRATAGLTVPDVHRAVPLSRRALEVRFKRLVGRTMQQEIRRVQMEQVKRLLMQSDLNMKEIADRCGLPDAQRLSVIFAREVGEPPSTYRQRRRGLLRASDTTATPENEAAKPTGVEL